MCGVKIKILVNSEGKIWCTGHQDFLDKSLFRTNKKHRHGYNYTCKECFNKKMRELYQRNLIKNRIKGAAYQNKYYQQNEKKAYMKKYAEDNKASIRVKDNVYSKKRRKTDDLFRLGSNIRTLVRGTFKKLKHNKTSKTQDILGCTIVAFKEYIESKFEPWMNWSNYGNWNGYPNKENVAWDLDHIIPMKN